MNGRVLGLNRDPDFSNVTDGLLMVDLRTTDPALLKRYLGETGSQAFLRRHELVDNWQTTC